MSFVRGLAGGTTLTLSAFFLAINSHERNRQAQAAALRSQSQILDSLIDQKSVSLSESSRQKILRNESRNLSEIIKNRWNEEIENTVRSFQRNNWNETREEIEVVILKILRRAMLHQSEKAKDIEEQIISISQGAVHNGKETANNQQRFDEMKDVAKKKVNNTISDKRELMNAKLGSVKNFFNRKIDEKMDLKDSINSKNGSEIESETLSNTASVEDTLQNRYVKSDTSNKSVEEVLENRYKPTLASK